MALSTTANEIVNYRGNAASAMGSDPAAAILAGDTDANLINQGIDLVFLHSFQKNKDLYDKKLQDQKDINDLIGSKDLQINEALDNDRQRLRSEYLQPIRDMLIANPNIKSNPDKFLELKAKIQDMQEAKQFADSRLVAIKNLDADIAKETDPQERARIQAHRDRMYSQDMFNQVKPYQKSLDFDDKIFAKGIDYKDAPTQTIEGDFLHKKTHSYNKPEDFVAEVNNKYLDSPTNAIPDQMDLYAKNAKAMPNDWKLQKINEWNAAIDKVNKDFNRAPGATGYIAPIRYEEITDNTSGLRDIVIPETSPRLVLAESLARHYYNKLDDSKELSELPGKILKDKAAANKDNADAELARARARMEIPADAELKRAMGGKYRSEVRKTNWEMDKEQAGAGYYTNTLLGMFDSKRYQGDDIVTLKDGSKLISMGGFAGDNKSALSDVEENALAKTFLVAGKKTKLTPAKILFNDKDPDNPYFVAEYEIVTKAQPAGNGKPAVPGTLSTKREVFTPNTVLPGLIDATVSNAEKRSETLSAAQLDLERRTGGKKLFNNNINSLLEKPDMSAGESKRKAFADAMK